MPSAGGGRDGRRRPASARPLRGTVPGVLQAAAFFQGARLCAQPPAPSVFRRARLIPTSKEVALSSEAFYVIWR
jgi:hypothetical protein